MVEPIKSTQPSDEGAAKPRKLEVRKKTVRTLTEAEVALVSGAKAQGRQGITYIDSCGCSFSCSVGCTV